MSSAQADLFLLEEDAALAVEPNRGRDDDHERRGKHERDAGENEVEDPLGVHPWCPC
jgi:hypothetical protein